MIKVKRIYPSWVIAWIILAVIITNFPYLVGFFTTPQKMVFTANLLNTSDTFSYYANMQLGANGYWLYRLPYSAIPNKPTPLFLLYTTLGHIANNFHLAIPFVYHVARVVFSIIFALVSYRFLSAFLFSDQEQKLALA